LHCVAFSVLIQRIVHLILVSPVSDVNPIEVAAGTSYYYEAIWQSHVPRPPITCMYSMHEVHAVSQNAQMRRAVTTEI
jgi:hypothetical protein